MSDSKFNVSQLSPDSAPGVMYDKFLEAGSIAYQRCATCNSAVFPPRVLCPQRTCSGTILEWQVSTGEGAVHSITWLKPRDQAPYNVALIDLDDGYRMMTNVVGSEEAEIGTRVVGSVKEIDGQLLPLFEVTDR